MFEDLIRKNRSYRRFYQSQPIHKETLRELVNFARLTPSGGNLQPLKYILTAFHAVQKPKKPVDAAFPGFLRVAIGMAESFYFAGGIPVEFPESRGLHRVIAVVAPMKISERHTVTSDG